MDTQPSTLIIAVSSDFQALSSNEMSIVEW